MSKKEAASYSFISTTRTVFRAVKETTITLAPGITINADEIYDWLYQIEEHSSDLPPLDVGTEGEPFGPVTQWMISEGIVIDDGDGAVSHGPRWDEFSRTDWTSGPAEPVEIPTGELLPLFLVDNDADDPEDPTVIAGTVTIRGDGVYLDFKGHPDSHSGEDELKRTIWIENAHGQIHVRVYADPEDDSPTHNICLASAREHAAA